MDDKVPICMRVMPSSGRYYIFTPLSALTWRSTLWFLEMPGHQDMNKAMADEPELCNSHETLAKITQKATTHLLHRRSILPIWILASILLCASFASRSSKTESITGRIFFLITNFISSCKCAFVPINAPVITICLL